MENSYSKNSNSRLPFGEFQIHDSGSVCSSRPSAPLHNAAFSTPPPPTGQLSEPRICAAPRPSCGPVYTPDHNLSNTFGQTPNAPRQLGGLRQTMPFAPVAQFHHSVRSNFAGEFLPTSWYANANIPSLPVNVNVPPLLSANVNVPSLPPINTNIPPPGFNPSIPPPPVFRPECLPSMATASTSALAGSPALLTSAQWASSFTDRTHMTSARQPIFEILPPRVPRFVSHQRMVINNMNENIGSAVQCVPKPDQWSVHGSVSNEGGISHVPTDHSAIAQVFKSSAVLSDKHDNVEKCHESSSLLLSAVDDSAHPSVGGTAVVSTTQENPVSDSHRRRASTRSVITVSVICYQCAAVRDFYVIYFQC